jgi:hypothetical protein
LPRDSRWLLNQSERRLREQGDVDAGGDIGDQLRDRDELGLPGTDSETVKVTHHRQITCCLGRSGCEHEIKAENSLMA